MADPDTWVESQPTEIQPALRAYLRVMGMLKESATPPRRGRVVPKTLPDFARYTNLRLVDFGGMGAVYRAHDTVLGRVVALKVIHADLMREADKVTRFLDEAQVASRLEHPNIVPVHDSGIMPDAPARPYFTMRLVAHQNPGRCGR